MGFGVPQITPYMRKSTKEARTKHNMLHFNRWHATFAVVHHRGFIVRHCPHRARSPTIVGGSTAATVATIQSPRQLIQVPSRPCGAPVHRDESNWQDSQTLNEQELGWRPQQLKAKTPSPHTRKIENTRRTTLLYSRR